jgi:hypothetical protein
VPSAPRRAARCADLVQATRRGRNNCNEVQKRGAAGEHADLQTRANIGPTGEIVSALLARDVQPCGDFTTTYGDAGHGQITQCEQEEAFELHASAQHAKRYARECADEHREEHASG